MTDSYLDTLIRDALDPLNPDSLPRQLGDLNVRLALIEKQLVDVHETTERKFNARLSIMGVVATLAGAMLPLLFSTFVNTKTSVSNADINHPLPSPIQQSSKA